MSILKKYLLIILLSVMFVNYTVAGCVQNNNKLGLVGLDSSNGTIYAGVFDHDNACACNSFRFLAAKTDNKMALSVLLSAKMSGRRVRIDILDPADCNSAFRVYIQDLN